MTKKPNSLQRRYTGALATPLKPRPKRRRLYAWRRSRRLRAKASDASGPAVSPSTLNSVPQSPLGSFNLKSFLQSDRLAAIDVDPSVVTALSNLLSSSYFIPGWRWEFDQKFLLLFEHYAIAKDDTNRWQKLCLALARAHVPGFQEKASRKKGRPHTMSPQVEERLYVRFSELRQDGQSDRNAARLMVKELRKSGQVVGSDAALLRRMQRRELKIQPAPKSNQTIPAGQATTQNSAS